jgi:hypothetical protein
VQLMGAAGHLDGRHTGVVVAHEAMQPDGADIARPSPAKLWITPVVSLIRVIHRENRSLAVRCTVAS